MICCDSCLDWYHGKCVGITKKMGKEMEEAGNEWTCPKCKDPNAVMPLAAAVETETASPPLPSPTAKAPPAPSPKKAANKKKGPSPSVLAKRKRPGSAMGNESKEERVSSCGQNAINQLR